jgi:UDP-N-acetylglucosamine transferase subunit ALG13
MAPTDTTPPARRRKICLAASGGGHVRQLLDLQPVWSAHDYFFVTEDTALGRNLEGEHRCYFVPHFAWGQAKLGAPFRMLGRALKSFVQSARLIARERPDVLISTGAGAVFPVLLCARLSGAKVIMIESFARFDKPSLFGRIASPFAHEVIVQSAKLAPVYPRAKVFDPLKILDREAPPKAPLLFATVGATLPFDRLVASVAALKAEGAIPERVILQTGVGGKKPDGLDEVVETLPFDRVKDVLREASIVICHGGTGSLITALREGCHVIAIPRLAELGEHYDDHQAEITEAFVSRDLVLAANSVPELAAALQEARNRKRVLATTDPVSLIAYLREILEVPRP